MARALKAKGMATAAVEWPISVDDDITYNIPGNMGSVASGGQNYCCEKIF